MAKRNGRSAITWPRSAARPWRVRRRESLAVPPEIFADFLLRWQHVHPSTRGQGSAFVETVLQQLQGFAMPAGSGRVKSSRVALRASVRLGWTRCSTGGPGSGGPDRGGDPFGCPETRAQRRARRAASGLLPAGFPGRARVGIGEPGDLPIDEARLLDILERAGASFATDLARTSGIEPSRVRRALSGLMARGLVTNDRFDPLRPGAESALTALTEATSDRSGGRSLRMRPRRSISGHAEGRWSRLGGPTGDPEGLLLAWTVSLLERYGVVTREMVALDPSAPAWSDLAPIFARAEWRGEVRRGYFVEGLSGVQYATEEAASELARLAAQPEASSPILFLSTVDPANLYGAGAPLDVELLDGGVARLMRTPGNFLAIREGRPVLIVESYGKRLTGLPWAVLGGHQFCTQASHRFNRTRCDAS